MSTTLRVAGLLLIAAIGILAASTGVGLWTLQEWPTPMLPTLYLGSTLFAMFLTAAFVWLLVTQRELATGIGADGVSAEERGLQRLVAITAGVLLSLLAVGVAGTWNLDVVRAEFVSSRESTARLEAALTDPSPIVKLAVCEEMFQRGWSLRSQQSLIAALDSEPAVALKCFQVAQEREWKGVGGLAAHLLRGWDAALMKSQDVAAACELAPWVPPVAEIAGESGDLNLLACAVGATNIGVRQCCGQVLSERGSLVAMLGDAESVRSPLLKPMYVSLIRHGFRTPSLPTESQRVAQTIAASDEGFRQWLVDYGCASLDPTAAQPEIVGGLVQLVESDSCKLQNSAQFAAAPMLVRLCGQIESAEPTVPVQQRVCDGAAGVLVENVVVAARLRLHHATRASFVQREAEFVDEGIVAAVRGGGRVTKEQKRREYLGRSAVEEFGLRTYGDSPNCNKRIYGEGLSGPAEVRAISVPCERYRPDMTVEEYLRENPTAQAASRDSAATIKDLNDGSLVQQYLKRRR